MEKKNSILELKREPTANKTFALEISVLSKLLERAREEGVSASFLVNKLLKEVL